MKRRKFTREDSFEVPDTCFCRVVGISLAGVKKRDLHWLIDIKTCAINLLATTPSAATSAA